MRVCPVCRLEYRDARTTCVLDGATVEEHEDPRVGTLIAGRYLIESVLGEGGMAVVYRARHTLVDRRRRGRWHPAVHRARADQGQRRRSKAPVSRASVTVRSRSFWSISERIIR